MADATILTFDEGTIVSPNPPVNYLKDSATIYMPDGYSYVTFDLTYTGSTQGEVTFVSTNGTIISVGEDIDGMFVPFYGGSLDDYRIILEPNVTKTVYVIINGDEEPTEAIQIIGYVPISSISNPGSHAITIEYDCNNLTTQLFKYEMGLHTYSDYDSINSPKLTTYLYSKTDINSWTTNTRVWSDSTFATPAFPYYYGYGTKVYKVGGPLDRSYGTKDKFKVVQTLWRSIRGKPPKVNHIIIGPASFYNAGDDTIDACVNVIMTKVGLITETFDASSLRQPTVYKYYMGYDQYNKQNSNDNFFAKWIFAESKFYPITGQQHAMYRLAEGFIKATGFDVDLGSATSMLLATGVPLALGAIALAIPGVNGAISSFFINGGPFSQWIIPFTLNPATATVIAILGLALLLVGVILSLFKKTKKTIQEECKRFLNHYTSTPYIELGSALSRTDNILTGGTYNNGYYCDGVYFYEQGGTGSTITTKELSYTNALVNEDPITTQFMHSLAADDPTLVVGSDRLLLLPYTSGIPVSYISGTTYYSAELTIVVNIDDCAELTTTPNSVEFTVPEGYFTSFISQADADNKLLIYASQMTEYIENQYNYSEILEGDFLGIANAYFTHEVRIENTPNEVEIYYDNQDLNGVTVGKKLFFDEEGRYEVLNGFYSVSGDTYYRAFYETISGTVNEIYVMENESDVLATGITSGYTAAIDILNLDYTSNWYFKTSNYSHLSSITNAIRSYDCYNPNDLLSQSFIVRGYYDGEDFQVYADNYSDYTLSGAPSGFYTEMIEWLEGDSFTYSTLTEMNINVEEICVGEGYQENSGNLFGFYIVGEQDGVESPLYNEVELTVEVYINNTGSTVLAHTYSVTTSATEARTYVSYDGYVQFTDNVNAILISSIDSTNPINNITYSVGSFTGCNSVTPTPTVTITPTITPTHTPTMTPTLTPNCVFGAEFTELLNPTPTPTITITPTFTVTPTLTITPTPEACLSTYQNIAYSIDSGTGSAISYVAQNVSNPSTGDVENVALYFRRIGNPSGTTTVYIYENHITSTSSTPAGGNTLLATSTNSVDFNDLPTGTPGLVGFNFSSETLPSDFTVVISYTGISNWDGSNYVTIGKGATQEISGYYLNLGLSGSYNYENSGSAVVEVCYSSVTTPTPTPTITPTITPTVEAPVVIKYGYLYNQYAYENASGIANTGWHVPTSTEFETLDTYVANNFYTLASTGTTYWNGGAGTNTNQFNGRGSGLRAGGTHGTGAFSDIKNYIYMATTTADPGHPGSNYIWASYGGVGPSPDFYRDYWSYESGVAVRLIKDSTSLTHGQTGTYTGNDGKVYPTICIGTQEWLATNLAETQYNDTSSIPEVTDNTTWDGLSTGARCSYNNDEGNAFI